MRPTPKVRRALCLASMAILGGCSCEIWDDCPTPCTSSQRQYTNSQTAILVSGTPVLQFDFTQDYTDYDPAGCNLSGMGGPIRLRIRSLVSSPVRFTYVVQGVGATGLRLWTYSGAVNRLDPSGVMDVGQVAQSATRVDVGVLVAFSNFTAVP